MSLDPTPMQTVGPYFSLGMMHEEGDNVLVKPGTEGEQIRVEGYVYDGRGYPLFNVLLEIWQANAHGRYNHPRDDRPLPLDSSFTGFGRASTDASGHYWFKTIKPGAVPYESGGKGAMLAPHIVVTVFASGVAYPLITRLFFADDPRNRADPILQRVPEKRRHTLLARPEKQDGETIYRYDIVLRGKAEELVLEGKVAASEAANDAPSGVGKAETVFLALR